MLSINRVMITGRLTRDPETRYLSSGSAVTTLGIAVNRRFMDKNNEWRDETFFIDVETWSKLAEKCAETLKKGRPVYVEGRLKMDTWERDGQKMSKMRIVAERVSPFDVPSRSSEGEEAGSGEEEGYSSQAPAKPAAKAKPAASAPSDNLEFEQPGVHDDFPF